MAVFKIGTTVQSETPDILFEIDPASPLPIGSHHIQLVVLDDSNNESVPFIFAFQVMDLQKPNAIITGPSQVDFKQNFTLSGAKSSDVGGKVVLYRWTLND